MSDTPGSTPLQPASPSSIGTRMAQIGFDQLTAALALQAKCIERDLAAAQRLGDALMHARAGDAQTIAQAWQSMTREYLATSVALWEQGLVSAARNQAAYGALLRDALFNAGNAGWLAAPAQMRQTARQAGTVPQAGNWMTWMGPFMGMRLNGKAAPGRAQHPAASADA
ncbi:hypothetical protein [Paraburkholderia sacchari]|uniref:hypothetical protein n=1 Tax=Paraburkholderia sacchari TaxID=159450 RepID=UPI001BCBBAFB|nr:hypothetical protein [Paraburkholderia sacchari]